MKIVLNRSPEHKLSLPKEIYLLDALSCSLTKGKINKGLERIMYYKLPLGECGGDITGTET